MAKTKSNKPAPDHPPNESGGDNGVDDAQQAEITTAEEAVRRAKEELRNAQKAYRKIRLRTIDQLKQIREMSVGEVVDGTLKQVRKHPGPGLLIAVLVGLFLGRIFRR